MYLHVAIPPASHGLTIPAKVIDHTMHILASLMDHARNMHAWINMPRIHAQIPYV